MEIKTEKDMKRNQRTGTSVAGFLGMLMLLSSPAVFADVSEPVLEEVVVTATKRATNLQDVPISVGVVSGEFINEFDIRDVSDIQNFVPGLQVQQTFGSWAVRIRGLGSGITNLAFDSSVPVYIDDVYCGRGKCMESAFMDMERLEVARGPQGALFGKSTIAGAINAITARPTEEFEAQLRVGAEFVNGGYTSSGFVSGALTDTVRGRLAFRADDLDGYTKNIHLGREDGDNKTSALRLGLEFDADDATTVFLKAELGKSETNGRNNQLVTPGKLSASSNDPLAEYRSDDRRSVSTGAEREDFYNYDWTTLTLNMDTDIGNHSLKGIVSYWEYENDWFLDVDGHPEAILNTALYDEYDQSTAELRLLSPSDQDIEYIAGIWIQKSELVTRQHAPVYPLFLQALLPPSLHGSIPPEATGTDRNFNRVSDAFSLYGQITWHMSDRLRAIIDIRYTEEDQEGVGASWPVIYNQGTFNPQRSPVAGNFAEYYFDETRSDDSVDPSIRLQYDVSDDMMIYGAYAEGSKAGGMKANDQALGNQLLAKKDDAAYLQRYLGVSSLTPQEVLEGVTLKQGNGVFDFEDEEAESWELGMKTSLFDGAAYLAAALFTTEFTNLQTSNYDGQNFIIGNAGSASVDGLEVEFSWQATENLRLNGSASWIDAKYDDFAGAQCVVDSQGNPRNSDCDDKNRENQKGEELERAPDVEFNVSAIWDSQVTNELRLNATTSFYYSGSYFVQPSQARYSTQDSFTKLDLRVALMPNDERWEVALIGRNLTDEMTIQHAYEIQGNQFRSLGIGRSVRLEGILRL
jgi:iron complex outermembrane receptor protein